MKKLDIRVARKVLEVVDAGLCKGVGEPRPGWMCVEAAVCFAMGEKHGDEPSCVAPADRAFKITLNDASWSSPAARARGLRRVAVMQLGTRDTDRQEWASILAELTIRRVLPVVLRIAGLKAAATRCEQEGTQEAVAAAAYATSIAAASAASAASATSYAAASATSIAAASYAAAAAAAAYAARTASYAAYAARTASYAAYASASYAAFASASAADAILLISAQCAEEAYERTGSPGVDLLRRIEADQ